MNAFNIMIVTFLGLVLGSFATALSYRMPRDISILTVKRSLCPVCQHTLGMADLVPVFSWVFLRGKCRHCRAPIGWRYPLIELATLALCLILYAVYGLAPETVLVFALAPIIVSIIDIDLHHKIIPDSLNLSVLLLGAALLVVNAFTDGTPLEFILAKGGIALGGAVLYGVAALALRQAVMLAVKRESMGLGDVKFFAAAGFWLGADLDAAALFMTIAGLCGVGLSLIWKKMFKDPEVPFGPALMIAFFTVLCLHIPVFINI